MRGCRIADAGCRASIPDPGIPRPASFVFIPPYFPFRGQSNMSITRVGTTKKYSDGWDNIFGGGKSRAAVKKTSRRRAAKSRRSQKRPRNQPPANQRKRPARKSASSPSSGPQTPTKPLRCTTSPLPAPPCSANEAACRRSPARTDADSRGSSGYCAKNASFLLSSLIVDLHDHEAFVDRRRHRGMLGDVAVELVAPAAPLASHLKQDSLF